MTKLSSFFKRWWEKYMFAVGGTSLGAIPFIVIGNIIYRLEPIRSWGAMVKFVKEAVVEYGFPDASKACIELDENNYTRNGGFVIWEFLNNIKSSTKTDTHGLSTWIVSYVYLIT